MGNALFLSVITCFFDVIPSVMRSEAEQWLVIYYIYPEPRPVESPQCPFGIRDSSRPMILLLINGVASLFLRSLFFLCPLPIFFIFIIVCKFPKQSVSLLVFAFWNPNRLSIHFKCFCFS